jgi:replicative DNA helicase
MNNENTDEEQAVMPSAGTIEKSVLSAILQKPEDLVDEFNELNMSREDFYNPGNKLFYDFIIETLSTGEDFDLIQMTMRAMDKGIAARIGGPAAITEIYTYCPTTVNFTRHCKILRDKSIRRELISKAAEIQALAMDVNGDDTADELADKAERAILDVRAGRETQSHTYTMNDLLKRASARYEDAVNNKDGDQFGLSTGFPTFDHMTGGLKAGNLYIIAARPSMGKTTILANFLEHVGMEVNAPCDFYSLEMNQDSVADRMLVQNARANLSDVMSGAFNKGLLRSLNRAFTSYANTPITVMDQSGMTGSQIRAKTRRRKKSHGVKAVFVDYLQIMGAENKVEQIDDRILCKNALKNMKEMAKECEIPVVVLAQLSRQADGVAASKHNFSFLKDCGNIEQDADVILTIGLPDDEQDETMPVVRRHMNILKQRNGPKGIIPLNFLKESVRFYE